MRTSFPLSIVAPAGDNGSDPARTVSNSPSSAENLELKAAETPFVPPARRRTAAFTLIESTVALGLLGMALGCAFGLCAQLNRILGDAKSSIYATQILQERAEQLRTGLWDQCTDPARLSFAMSPATATAVNFPASEVIKVEPLTNPNNINIFGTRSAAGAVSVTGPSLTAEKSVKVTLSVSWQDHRRTVTRGMMTILTNGGI